MVEIFSCAGEDPAGGIFLNTASTLVASGWYWFVGCPDYWFGDWCVVVIAEGGLAGDRMVSNGDCLVLKFVRSVPGVVQCLVSADAQCGF